jgi:hypothetical protein
MASPVAMQARRGGEVFEMGWPQVAESEIVKTRELVANIATSRAICVLRSVDPSSTRDQFPRWTIVQTRVNVPASPTQET